MVFLNKFLSIPLEDGGRVITGIALFLRIIPAYFLVKLILNKTAAFIAIIFVALYPVIKIPQEAALAEGLYSLIIFSGFLFSYLALKTEKIVWYLLAGITWGVVYLARLEGWLFLIPLMFLTALKLFYEPKKKLVTIKLLAVSILATFTISLPYLTFVHQVYGSWNLNPRLNIIMTAPVSTFVPYKDYNGITTLAQAYFSGDPKYYKSNLWHPTPFLFWRALGRHWSTLSITPTLYFKFFKETIPLLTLLGGLGIVLTILAIFRHKLQLILIGISFFALGFSLLDFSLVSLEFLSPVIFNPEATFWRLLDQFWRMLSTKGYFPGIARDVIVIVSSLSLLIIKRGEVKKFVQQFYLQRLKIYLPLSLFFGFLPLLFHNFATKYAAWVVPVLVIFASFFISSVCSSLIRVLPKKYPFLPALPIDKIIPLLTVFSLLWMIKPLVDQSLDTKYSQYKQNNFFYDLRKKPGLVILKDHGPGAKIAVFYEAPVFYAQGELFYFMTDSNVPLEETLNYLEENQVDYLVADRDQAYLTHKPLRPLMLAETKLSNWQMIYSDPPPGTDILVTDTHTDMLVTVWKRID
ncbi:MAG: hypothetical protein UU26_C0006G0010 [Candidatus Daviesbacteria bacterium GW2011_GWC1_40_9]|nr:MAG: hypothetical protein UU26_C0006G0010 [Candidatus Daviesbacteria bacterium GW2011_GWC1_40_9]